MSVTTSSNYKKTVTPDDRIREIRRSFPYFVENVIQEAAGERLVLRPYQWEWFKFVWNNPRCVVLAPRGHGKSIILTVCYSLYKVCLDPEHTTMIITGTHEAGVKFMRQIGDIFRTRAADRIWDVFGAAVDSRREPTDTSFYLERMTAHREPTISAYGVESTSSLGLHCRELICDDIATDSNQRTAGNRALLEDWFGSRLLPIPKTPKEGGATRIFGTRWHYHDIYSGLLAATDDDGKPVYASRVYKDFDGENWLWPDMWGAEEAMAYRRSTPAGEYKYSAQYRNEPVPQEKQVFDTECIGYASIHKTDEMKVVPNVLQIAIGCDPAATTEADAVMKGVDADYTAIAVVGLLNGFYYLLEVYRERISPLDVVKKIIEIHARYDRPKTGKQWIVRHITIEDVAFQSVFRLQLQRNPNLRGKVVGLKRKRGGGGKSKSRLLAMQPIISAGRLSVIGIFDGGVNKPVKGCEAFLDELAAFPVGGHDDTLDAVNDAIGILEDRRVEAQEVEVIPAARTLAAIMAEEEKETGIFDERAGY